MAGKSISSERSGMIEGCCAACGLGMTGMQRLGAHTVDIPSRTFLLLAASELPLARFRVLPTLQPTCLYSSIRTYEIGSSRRWQAYA